LRHRRSSTNWRNSISVGQAGISRPLIPTIRISSELLSSGTGQVEAQHKYRCKYGSVHAPPFSKTFRF
jgi:hypothetical protein